MSAQFALLLNMPVTRLLIAAEDSWQVVGEASLDSDDLGAALGALRDKGEAVAGGPFSCLLILPDDQIRYLTAPANGPDAAATARAALDGATPYAVDDLAFDWAHHGDDIAIAAVAKETLDEADSFVREHGFEPAGMIASPDPGTFPQRPVFDSPDLTRGAAILPIAGAYAPKPPPAFASRREAPPARPTAATPAPQQEAAITQVAPRMSLAPAPAQPAIASLGSAAPPAPALSPAITGRSPAAVRSTAAPALAEPEPDDKTFIPRGQIGGKPRYLGLVLTLVLLAILAIVAIWSMTLGDGADLTLEDDPEAVADIALLAPETAEPAPDQIATLPDIDAPTEELLPALPPQVLAPQPITDAELAARYAATGIWQRAPRTTRTPVPGDLDRLYVASIDPQVQPSDAIALPPSETLRGDALPATPLAPAAPDQTYALDAQGRVIATPEGALSPDGILVFAGRPPITVPLRPDVTEPADAVPEQDQRLAALRPAARPGDLQDSNERAQLGGRTLEEFASIRPQLRPKAPQELAAEIAAAAASAAAAVQNAPAQVAPVDPFASATRLASATSRKPQTRPGNFARIVERARTQPQEPASSGSGRVVASVAPRNVRPSGPVPTTVSRAATMENAINLRRINLIGVFGKPTSRSALIRLRNGRFQKVQVGDRIDGGRVAAIGESELRYVKSGRNLTLTIPSS
ncbi:MAG: hypothetical protein AAFQ47_03425 [Pseudomonadota bacterium]